MPVRKNNTGRCIMEEGELIDGLGKNADAETKIKKILEDRK